MKASSSVWQQVLQMLTTQPNKEFYLQHVSLFGCAGSIFGAFLYLLCCEHLQGVCCQIDEVVFLICNIFLFAARWALSATV